MSTNERANVSANVKRALVGLGGTCLLAVAGMGLLHTSVGKPLLMKVGGCPAANAPPEGVEESQKRAILSTRGTAIAPKRHALGFELDKTTFADVEAWAKRHGISCNASRENTTYSCARVPASALPASASTADLDELELSFRVKDKTLISLSTWRWHLPEGRAASELSAVTRTLRDDLGEPATNEGDHASLGREPFAGSIVKYNFKDYLCTVSGLNLPTKGITMHESYVTGVVD